MTKCLRMLCCSSAFLACALFTSTASADVPILEFHITPSTAQAGGHPDVEARFSFESNFQYNPPPSHNKESECDCEDVKDINVSLPPGFIGRPQALPRCTVVQFTQFECPTDSQVGVVFANAQVQAVEPVFNMVPPPNQAGLLAFNLPFFRLPFYTVFSARTGSDYGLNINTSSIEHLIPPSNIIQVIWGVPASHSHDRLRYPLGQPGYLEDAGQLCDANDNPSSFTDPATVVKICAGGHHDSMSTPSNSPEVPFLENPTRCAGPLESTLEVTSYDFGVTHASDPWPTPSGCDLLSFNPSLTATATTNEADSPSGLDVNLKVPQFQSPTLPSPSEIKETVVTLPEGMSIDPNAADGKTACADADALFGSEEEAHCPEYAKIGTLTVESAILPGPLPGAVYLGEPQPGNRYRLFLVADGYGIHVKLPGTVTPDPITGQVVATFKDLPQTPFSAFNLHFFGSERGALATPTRCGTYPVTTTFGPWDESLPSQTSTQYFTIDSGPKGTPCPGATRPFGPSFGAASADSNAAVHTPFSIEFSRADGDQNLSGVSVKTPPGLLATLKGVPYCSDATLEAIAGAGYTGAAELASPSCPAASRVGSATAGAGAGTHPVYLPGSVYLAGPYKGAPLSLAVVTPAVSGPYDLGNVVVRTALHVDPFTARITAESDPFPQIREGIPLRHRTVRVNLDRQDFTLNPTNCEPLPLTAQLIGSEGATASFSEHFQTTNCALLDFAPKLSLRLRGKHRRAANPALQANLKAPAGSANIGRVSVALPHALFIDNEHIQNPCTRPQLAKGACPQRSQLGVAKATTPLLEKPLEGPVYFVSGFGHYLPDIVVDLKGQVEVMLDGRIDTDKQGGVRTTFETVPDAPVSSFSLSLFGGKRGLLSNSTNLCKAPQYAIEKIAGQNGKTANARTRIVTPCSSAGSRKKGHK